jgi:predicted alpha-1,2-mannosidase
MRLWSPLGIALLAACSSSPSTATHDFADDDASVTRPMATPVSPLFVGSGGFGFGYGSSFVGAAAPQGMMKAGPDTSGAWGTINFLHFSGYWYDDDTIQGFSHMHLHGTGAQDYAVLGIMPTDAFDASRTTATGYASKFDKSTEKATFGRYDVTLTRGNIGASIVATAHAAHHRYTYPSSANSAHVIVDLDHKLESGEIKDVTVDLDPIKHSAKGSFRSVGQMSRGFGGSMIYFALRTKTAWGNAVVWANGQAPAPLTHADGTKVGFDLDFDLSNDHSPIEVQVGISLVSVDGAQANLDAEMPAWSFDDESTNASNAWNQATSVIKFTGGTPAQQTMLNAALYHLYLMPTVLSDTDGSYVGLDSKVAKADFHYCSDMSLWDTYRTLHPLYDLVAPDRARDSARSLVAMAKAGGYFPKWPIATGEAGTMIGASAEVVLADAYLKGTRDFDAEGAYQIMRAAALGSQEPVGGRGGRNQVGKYMQDGYVPSSVGGSVSWTIEYGQDDFALANFAEALGHHDDAIALSNRAHGWQKLYDSQSGFLWAKGDDGSWSSTHGDPSTVSDDFVEANAWHSVWGPWYDADTLITTLGGKDAFVAKLESFFVQGKADYDAVDWTTPGSLSRAAMRKYYWGGNEPDMHAPYLFALAGRPDLTQKWVRWIENEVYGAGADGIPGNDDGGTMSAWLVFSALGFYPIAGSDRYVVGAPMVAHAELQLVGGSFIVDAQDVSDQNVFVQSVTLNGAPLMQPILRHADLKPGGSLMFVMGPKPSKWGR